MKKADLIKILSFVLIALFIAGCSTHSSSSSPNSGKIPPGQAKKMSGSKSAKPYAPGQQKKRN
ncbi:hypothetical protein [Flavobacterium johnsoniae]|jgi:outer membrane PBP1 activator LpoA protein|uniref:hypothetical protein n=1 Tax=Flavobacterium TaxID=237 RepID=UPI000311BA3F|nr:hypothetical protein [Flavobacterium johnsoniae]OXE98789.1 hypothetical protein B0A63_14165 [Flavobacterium johnsoniae UW101]WQG81094.1 hypothetical protein SR927_24165 [Flavobacterium johnsoniae UW101]SHL31433.1 hypothetical protein SAMN05444146_3454 [Flavobacterium johnsoniae]